MAQDVKLTMDGTLLNWLKNAGDAVKAGEIIAEFEADKATVEVEAPSDGVLVKLLAEVGDELSEGAVIAQIGAASEGAAPAPEAKPAEEAKPAAETKPAAEQPAAPASASVTEDGRIKASPLARNIAREKGIDLAQVQGTGPDGRIVKSDVENFTPAAAPAPEAKPAAEKAEAAPAPALGGRQTYGKLPSGDDVEIIDVSKMRRAIADNTVLSKQMIPHFYVTVDIDMDALLGLRSQLNASLEQEGVKISVNDLVVKATALTLRKFPNLNTHYYGDKLVRHKRINIGIAVALPNNGLINVVSPDADRTALSAMAQHHKAMFDRAREGKIKPEDIRGATFTVSNLGPYDVEQFGAIINPPEAGILAVSSARKVPVVKPDGSLGVGNRMKVTISVDHRVSDGAEGAQFMQHFRSLIENPMKLLV
jgi:pyruvate dehydrogenase E2 component (dihydrolipoamide acetyltransferase)